jgi:hypothetical protein
MDVNSLGLGNVEDGNLLKTVEVLLEESEGDRRSLMMELRKKEVEIQEKLDLISYLKGEKTPHRIDNEVDPSTSILERKITEIEEVLGSKIGELGQVKANVEGYDKKISAIEEKANRIVSLGDKAAEVLKKRINSMNKEIISREDIISELKLRENIQKVVNKELNNKIRNVKNAATSKSFAETGE